MELKTFGFLNFIAIVTEGFTATIPTPSDHFYEPLLYNQEALWISLQTATPTEPATLDFTAFYRKFALEINCNHLSHPNWVSVTSLKTNDVIQCTGRDINAEKSEVLLKITFEYVEGTISIPEVATYHIVRSDSISGHSFTSPSVIHSRISTKQNENLLYERLEKPLALRRKARSTDTIEPGTERLMDNRKSRVCTLELTADPFVWKYVLQKHGQNQNNAVDEVHAIMRDHVTMLNRVFTGVQFPVHTDGQTQETMQMQFEIHKIWIWNDSFCDQNFSDICNSTLKYDQVINNYRDTVLYRRFKDEPSPTINYPDYSIPVIFEDYFGDDYFSDRYGQYCLSILFTARDLYDKTEAAKIPVNGLSMGADLTNSEGVCREHNFAYVNLYRNVENPYKPSTLTHLVLAHEVAHSLGAKHDIDSSVCKPINDPPDDGFYLMHNITVDGKDPNNYRLSPCSVNSIGKILSDPSRSSCFKDKSPSICGNGLVEDGEDCDCGDVCYLDNACYSSLDALGCTFKNNASNSNTSEPGDGSIEEKDNETPCKGSVARSGLCIERINNIWTNMTDVMTGHWLVVVLGTISISILFVLVILVMSRYKREVCFCSTSASKHNVQVPSTIKDETDHLVQDVTHELNKGKTDESHTYLLDNYSNGNANSVCVAETFLNVKH